MTNFSYSFQEVDSNVWDWPVLVHFRGDPKIIEPLKQKISGVSGVYLTESNNSEAGRLTLGLTIQLTKPGVIKAILETDDKLPSNERLNPQQRYMLEYWAFEVEQIQDGGKSYRTKLHKVLRKLTGHDLLIDMLNKSFDKIGKFPEPEVIFNFLEESAIENDKTSYCSPERPNDRQIERFLQSLPAASLNKNDNKDDRRELKKSHENSSAKPSDVEISGLGSNDEASLAGSSSRASLAGKSSSSIEELKEVKEAEPGCYVHPKPNLSSSAMLSSLLLLSPVDSQPHSPSIASKVPALQQQDKSLVSKLWLDKDKSLPSSPQQQALSAENSLSAASASTPKRNGRSSVR